jgi:FixJ family two-component response regulator
MAMSKRKRVGAPGQERTILIVDDDRDIGDILRNIITDQTDYKVVWIAEGDLALDAASYLQPSLLVLDYKLPTMHGLDLYDRLQTMENMRGLPTILISGNPNLPFEDVRSRGMYILQKPFELDDFLDAVAQMMP